MHHHYSRLFNRHANTFRGKRQSNRCRRHRLRLRLNMEATLQALMRVNAAFGQTSLTGRLGSVLQIPGQAFWSSGTIPSSLKSFRVVLL